MEQSNRDFEKGQLLFTTPTGDKAYFYKDSMVVELTGKRRVVSTSILNGGTRTDLQFVYNNSCGRVPEVVKKEGCGMRGKNIVEHNVIITKELGLPVHHTAAMGTAALIENAMVATRSYHGVTVMAVATAGIDVNGGRAGDPASHNEFTRTPITPPGTINIFLFIDAKLDDGPLTRAIITATEAKTAALQELMANSRYSEGLATGSGTDSMIVVSNEESSVHLFNTGKHVLLGEMIGQSVKEAVTKALSKQSGMNSDRQASIEWQCKRYGITREQVKTYYEHCFGTTLKEGAEREELDRLDRDNDVLATVAAVVHLCDQTVWHLIAEESLLKRADTLLNALREEEGVEPLDLRRKRSHDPQGETPTYKRMISDITLTLAEILYKRLH